ncbi:MAG: helix-turn-helix transcriptional regulator [Peptostreptococcaceae bacterium]|nr:helix-turn-helix transcriptional regulator [uncultured Criibacterium sp.]MBS6062988.1 helix-turn-helix transcriptional regulator [Peptostreptococcaceae bacterium]
MLFFIRLSVLIIAKIGYINKFYLIHKFKKLYGVMPIEYIIEKRYLSAKDLLLNSNYSMQEISSIVGFNSQSYFNQLFKKKAGITPGKFRKLYAKTTILE